LPPDSTFGSAKPAQGFAPAADLGSRRPVSAQGEREAEVAVEELRLFISLYKDVEVAPGSRIARQLEAARRAVAGYEAVERKLAARTA
jgi:hypothetical protein